MKWLEYPRYKDSGIEWLGEVPNSWPVTRLRFRAKINPSKAEINGVSGDTMVSFVPMEAVGEYGGLRLDQAKLLDEVANGYTYFREGDVVVAKITPCFENWKGSVAQGLENGLGFGTTELQVIRPADDLDRRYLFYLTITHAFRSIGASYMYGAGGQKRVPDDFVRNFTHPFPPSDEQRAIAAFLDRETGRIDTLMEKKQRQIKLLQEKRAALISHAVTRGLDPTVPLKDSEVEWFGQIPAHWEIMKLKYLVEGGLINGLFKKKEFFGSGVKLVNVFDVYRKDFLIDHTSLDLVDADRVEQSKYAVRSGDIFFVRSSLKLEGVGRSVCALDIGEPTVFECHVVRGRPIQQKISPKFLIHFLNSIYVINRFISLANLVTMATIDQDKIKSLEVSLPPRDEQDKIMAFLDRETETMENLEKSITKSIEKLKEYRTALISAAVTGRIDVREAGT